MIGTEIEAFLCKRCNHPLPWGACIGGPLEYDMEQIFPQPPQTFRISHEATTRPYLPINLSRPHVSPFNGPHSPISYNHSREPLSSSFKYHTHTLSFHHQKMSLNTSISSSFNLLLKKTDADLGYVPRKPIGFVKLNGRCGASVGEENVVVSSGVLFQPFDEVKKDEFIVPISPQMSLARQKYFDECEAAINEQINVEYNVSYVYHALYAYFDRDNVALKGFAKFFKESSDEEREHAEKLMKYQNMRGGRVTLHTIVTPPSEFEHVEKGDALYAMELALSLEKLVNEKLLALHAVADRNNDPQMADFIESEFLAEQVEAIKKISDYVSQLRRVGKGHGVWHFDQMLLEAGVAA